MIKKPEIPVADMRQESFFLRFYLGWFIMDERFFMIVDENDEEYIMDCKL